MAKKKNKVLKIAGLGLFVTIFAASCTANFCSPKDQAYMLYQKDSGVVTVNEDTSLTFASGMETILTNAAKAGYAIPSDQFFVELDAKVIDYAKVVFAETYGEETALPSDDSVLLKEFGYVKFLGSQNSDTLSTDKYLFGNWNYWVSELSVELGVSQVPDSDFSSYYQSQLQKEISSQRACIALKDGEYGPTGEKIPVEGKTWGDAFNEGIVEGLLVYPVAAAVEFFTNLFGANGWGQVWAILIVTLIVRGVLIAATFKSTMAQQKMQLLKPEIDALQQKYPNSNTNQYEKQQLAAAQMALYKKNGINPFSQIIIMLFQFPIFIAVWGAMTGSAVLASDSVMGLNLNASLGTEMLRNFFSSGWWVAVCLFVLMAAAQFISMKLPQWMTASKQKKITRMGKNPAENKQQSQMKMMMTVMFIFIIFMSWSLPAAMGVYWFVGALISIVQTVITQKVMAKK